MEDARRLAEAQNTPVSESPRTDPPAEGYMHEEAPASPTESMETDQEHDNAWISTDPAMEPVYNAKILENSQGADIIIEDQETVWHPVDHRGEECASFAFDVPTQQLSRYLQQPENYLPCLIAAAKMSKNEVVYNELTKEEKELFNAAKQKELRCWLDTNTVKAIVRDHIHPSRILSSRWILTWKQDLQSPLGKKAKARLVVKGFQDPDIGILNSDSPTLTRPQNVVTSKNCQ